jgi:hypothetical protein
MAWFELRNPVSIDGVKGVTDVLLMAPHCMKQFDEFAPSCRLRCDPISPRMRWRNYRSI